MSVEKAKAGGRLPSSGHVAPAKVIYNLRELVEATGINRSAVYVALANGSLASFKLGRRRMVSARALQEWLDRLERSSGQKQVRA